MTRFLHRFASRRVHSWIAVFVFASGLVASQAHLAFERHEVCADHGEWVESDSGHAHAHGALPIADACGHEAEGGFVLASSPELAPDHHGHHCYVLDGLRKRSLAAAEPVAHVAAEPTPDFDARRVDTGPHASEPVYRRAPKNSPPTA